ncbi:hypothetical protein Dimus_012552 [Dionaea muscipula]
MDRLSSLPEDVLGHILSFLGTKFAVRTSILSKRWMFLYTFATSLDFYCSTRIPAPSFIYSTNRVLMHHNNIRKLTLFMPYYDGCMNDSHVTSWIAAVVFRGVEELKLCFGHLVDDWAPPRCLFSSQTLVTFILSADTTFMVIPSSVWLPSLKILHMTGIRFSDSNSLTRLFNGCPLLQDLSLDSCIWETGQVYTIPAPMLRRLRIITTDSGDPTGSKVEFDVPRLERFEFCGDVSELYCIHISSALATANIAVGERSKWDLVISLISSVSKVRRVKLFDPKNKVWVVGGSSSRPELPIFSNLSSLEVSFIPQKPWGVGWTILHHLLSNSPNMETLVFRKGFRYCYYVIKGFLQSPTLTWGQHLKVIQVYGFSGSAEEEEMVTWFLRETLGLNQLNVHVDAAADDLEYPYIL